MSKMRYVGTLNSTTSSVEFRLNESFENAVQGIGTPDGATYTVKLGNEDAAGAKVYGDVADNTATDEFGFRIEFASEWCKVETAGGGSSEDMDIFATTI